MLITFSSNSSADVLMLDKHALLVLNALGRPYESIPAEGVITHAQLAESIATLEKSIANDESKDVYEEEEEREEKGEDKLHPIQESVSLARRAFPLLDMMKKALPNEKDQIVWRTGNAW